MELSDAYSSVSTTAFLSQKTEIGEAGMLPSGSVSTSPTNHIASGVGSLQQCLFLQNHAICLGMSSLQERLALVISGHTHQHGYGTEN